MHFVKYLKKMKKVFWIVLFFPFLLNSCNPAAEKQTAAPAVQEKDTTGAGRLVEYLSQAGDYVNSRQFPSMIKPETVLQSLDSSSLVIDMRERESFMRGHIKGARNVAFEDLPGFFEKGIKPYEYEKIILVCDHGQRSSYATMLLRLMGYGNVYSMRWGMTAWNPDLGGGMPWSKIISSGRTAELEVNENLPAAEGDYPVLNTGKTSGEEIFHERIKSLFRADAPKITISAQEVFESPSSFYIINYERKDKYDSGHIPGAIRYKPGATLGIEKEMKTIPAEKEIVIYCATGHNSAFVAAYLRLLGYKARSLRYGNNSFMHDKMLAEKTSLGWEAFTEEMQNSFPYSKGSE